MLSLHKNQDLFMCVFLGQNASRQLATSSENLVASTQFLVALAISELQFRALRSAKVETSFFIVFKILQMI